MPTREPELYKDKIEVSLDGRQIFYLFFGGAVIVGLVFVLGVMVGRRVEARGHVERAHTHAAADPLAALDRLDGGAELSFQTALVPPKDAAAPPVLAAAPGEKTVEEKVSEKAAEKKKAEKVEKVEKVEKTEKTEKTEKAEKAEKAEKVEKVEKAEKVEKKPEKLADEKAEKKAAEEKVEKPEKKVAEKSEKPEKPEAEAPKSRYTVQLSSFQDKQEAEAFLASVRSAGFQAQLSEAEVSGKGTFYRVRLGTYRSIEAANDAKSDYEKSSKKTASVMRL